MGSLALRPGDSLTILSMALSIGFRIFSFLPSCYSSYGASNFYPGGTFTHCSCQPSLDAHLSFLIRAATWSSTRVLRGCVYEPETRKMLEAIRAALGFADIQVVSFADLYAGKLAGALDRQHPRDLFEVRDLLANEGISDEWRKAFIVCLISVIRPMHEALAGTGLAAFSLLGPKPKAFPMRRFTEISAGARP